MAAESIHAEWISPIREWIENMIRLAEDENISEDDFFEQLQNGLKSLPETRDDGFIDRLWELQADGFKAGWEANWDEDVVFSGKCRAKDPSRCRVHGNPHKGTTRENKVKNISRGGIRVNPTDSYHKQKSTLMRALARSLEDGPTQRGVLFRKDLGWVDIPSGSQGMKLNKAKRLEKEINKMLLPGEKRVTILEGHGGSGGKHALRDAHGVSIDSVAEALLKGKIYSNKNKDTRIDIVHNGLTIVLEREIKMGSNRKNLERCKFHTVTWQ